MSFIPILSIAAALAICALPVPVLRGGASAHVAGGDPPPPAVIRNAWIASSLRVSVFVGLFALGAAGDVWPAIAAAFGFGAGLLLLGIQGRALETASAGERPATLPGLLAQGSGDSKILRFVAGSITVVALLGLVGAEAAALVAVTAPLTGAGAGIALFLTLMVGALLYAGAVGAAGMLYAAQAFLGAILVGLFGASAFLLYLTASGLPPMPSYGALALVALTAACLVIVAYRQTKYIETPHLVRQGEASRWRRVVARQVRLLQRFVNLAISVLALFCVAIAGMVFYSLGPAATLLDAVAGLGGSSHVPALGCVAIAALAFAYPLVDPVNWHATGRLLESALADAPPAFVQRPVRMVAAETTLMGAAIAGLGAMAALSTDLPPGETSITDLVRQLLVFDNAITDAALTLLVVGLFAMAAATMGMGVATAASVVGRDLVPAIRQPVAGADVGNRRATSGVVSAIALVTACLWIGAGVPSAGTIDSRFFALALAFVCLQMSVLPLLLARLRGASLRQNAALLVIAGGAAAGLGSLAIHAVTLDHLWLWLAVPACLASGLAILVATLVLGRADPRG